ncbi:MAG: preprotein translocase subunit SecY [Candidatus Aenigmatarchaeota archaeon]
MDDVPVAQPAGPSGQTPSAEPSHSLLHPQHEEEHKPKKSFKFDLASIGTRFPSVKKPELKLPFRQKLVWTGAILVLFYVLGSINAWGIDANAVARFDFLEIIFGSKFGSIITLGIGPIVTASIILQLLVGAKILNWDTKTSEGKAKFMGTQKLLAVAFSLFEAIAYVVAGAVPPAAGGGAPLMMAVILQLAAGGILIIFMDEVVSKWGIGSGVSLFIAAGVAKTIIVRVFNPLTAAGAWPSIEEPASGLIPGMIAYIAAGQPTQALISLFPLLATGAVFVIVLFAQAMKIEIPMAITMPYGRFGSRRWPLRFIYTSNIPVILVAAVLANVQVVVRTMANQGMTWLGTYDQQGSPLSGLALFLQAPSSTSLMVTSVIAGLFALGIGLLVALRFKKWVLRSIVVSSIAGLFLGSLLLGTFGLPQITSLDASRVAVHMLIMVVGSVIFGMFWVQTAGMDVHSVAEQFKSSFLSIPGFRRDPRIIESVLQRYIPAVTVLGSAFVGFLAGFADLTNAIGSGTGILLTVMIVYQLYEQIGQQHGSELPQWLQKWMGVA